MAFTTQEIQLLKKAKQEGKTKEQALAMLTQSRQKVTETEPTQTEGYSFKEAGGDIAETFMGVGEQLVKTGEDVVTRDIRKPDEGIVSRVIGTGADVFRGIGRGIGELAVGAGKVALPQKGEDAVKKFAGDVATQVADTDLAKGVMAEYQELSQQEKDQVDNILGYMEGVAEIGTAGIAPKVIRGIISNVKRGATATGEAVATGVSKLPDVTLPTTGATQIVKEQAERIPRAIGRGVDTVKEAQERAVRIQNSTPAVAKAIEVNVPDNTIKLATEADAPTVQAMKQMQEIAESGERSARPARVPAEAVSSQYKLIDTKRSEVGKQIEQAIQKIPDTKVSMGKQLGELDKTLRLNGMYLKNGKVVRTADSSISQTELNAIQKLYDEALRGIDNIGRLDAKAVHSRDRLFSKLKRENAKINNLDDIIIKTEDGTTSIYDAFRDIYRTTLDDISPEMRKLNKEYAILRNTVDEADNSIFKSARTKGIEVDPEASAAVNLRRLEGEALSTPYFQEVAKKLDDMSRELGYEGARPSDLITFSEDLRLLYPETIPKTGFQGGIRTSIGGSKTLELLEKVMSAGQPNTVDQQRALRELLEELSNESRAGATGK